MKVNYHSHPNHFLRFGVSGFSRASFRSFRFCIFLAHFREMRRKDFGRSIESSCFSGCSLVPIAMIAFRFITCQIRSIPLRLRLHFMPVFSVLSRDRGELPFLIPRGPPVSVDVEAIALNVTPSVGVGVGVFNSSVTLTLEV